MFSKSEHSPRTPISRLLVASLAVTSTWASPLSKPRSSDAEKRQSAPFPVTGLVGGSETVQPRLEIRDLQQNADQWNMYLLGLQRFQAADQNDMLSWFQIAGEKYRCSSTAHSLTALYAGIHGDPGIPWNDVSGNGNGGGYCTHQSNLFLSWHRPYMALYEVSYSMIHI